MYKTRQFFDSPLWSLFAHQALLHNGKQIYKLDQIEFFYYLKKLPSFDIHNNFLVPIMDESAPKTFITIQVFKFYIVRHNQNGNLAEVPQVAQD